MPQKENGKIFLTKVYLQNPMGYEYSNAKAMRNVEAVFFEATFLCSF